MIRTKRKGYFTQWASQYYVAAELTRRGYLVSLTMGNAPVADLLVVSQAGARFMVEVKGQATRNFWILKNREIDNELYFILVYLGKVGAPHYYILSCKELMQKRAEYKEHIDSTSGKYRDSLGGINFSTAREYENRWDSLPE
jgi:hypothetical protein